MNAAEMACKTLDTFDGREANQPCTTSRSNKTSYRSDWQARLARDLICDD